MYIHAHAHKKVVFSHHNIKTLKVAEGHAHCKEDNLNQPYMYMYMYVHTLYHVQYVHCINVDPRVNCAGMR